MNGKEQVHLAPFHIKVKFPTGAAQVLRFTSVPSVGEHITLPTNSPPRQFTVTSVTHFPSVTGNYPQVELTVKHFIPNDD
jgi:hypothetical protein